MTGDELIFMMCNRIMRDCKSRAHKAQQAIKRPCDLYVAVETVWPLKPQDSEFNEMKQLTGTSL